MIRWKTKTSRYEPRHSPVDQRHRAEQSGGVAEALVIIWLALPFHRFLTWRQKRLAGEIDLFDLRGPTISFIEVKY